MDDEISIVESVYCKPGEFSLLLTGHEQLSETVIAVNVQKPDVACSQKMAGFVTLTLTMSSEYPSVVPSILISGDGLCQQLISWLKDHWPSTVRNDIVSAVNVADKLHIVNEPLPWAESLPCRTILLHLDHMRNRVAYVKTVVSWSKELALVGRLVFYERLIVILFQGTVKNIKECLVRFRTVSVDIDSRGRSCKERMMSVLLDTETVPESFGDFAVVDVTTSSAFKELFARQPLDDACSKHIKTLLSKT